MSVHENILLAGFVHLRLNIIVKKKAWSYRKLNCKKGKIHFRYY